LIIQEENREKNGLILEKIQRIQMRFINFIIKLLFGFLLLIMQFTPIFATHNRAGEVTFEQLGPLTIRATVTTYTMTSSVAADRDSIEIFWGDGSSTMATRANGWGDPQPNDVKINYYIATHTYSGRATYTISMYDPNRIAGILNVNYPDSANVPFYLETTFSFLNTQFLGDNNSVRLLAPPIDFGCVGQVFRHNPNAFDIDGDSLSYALIIPLQQMNTIVPDYRYPDQIGAGPHNLFTLDRKNGDIIWNAPMVAGDYNIAFRVNEYRQGILISSTIRDMQILIRDQCQNQNPDIEVIEEICVFAGEIVETKVNISDADPDQMLQLSASGAPFISAKNKATLTNKDVFLFPPYSAIFSWETSCEDVSEQYYQIIFKVTDNGFSDTTGLTNLKALRIKVVAPPPQNTAADPVDDHMIINWDYPYLCSFTDNEYFRGFSVWRRTGSASMYQDSCSTGIDPNLYQKIVFLTNENDAIHYFYEDFEVEKELNYCYRILPEFARKTMDGFPYNPVSGQASNETCNFIPSKAPLITKVSVLETSDVEGRIAINWQMVDPELFDTIKFPGPYTMRLKTSGNGTDFFQVDQAVYSGETYKDIIADTSFIHEKLNTIASPQHYTISMYFSEQEMPLGSAPKASTVFITPEAIQGKNRIKFNSEVPWHNSSYMIYRKTEDEDQFSLIGTSTTNSFDDFDIENEKLYCYYVISKGNYSFLEEKIISNQSQIACIEAIDFIPICAPLLTVTNDCENAPDWIPGDELFNNLSWDFPDCPERISEVSGYQIYFGADADHLGLTQTVEGSDIREYKHQGNNGLQGCYAVFGLDQYGNPGMQSNVICMQNCPVYELPNVFTPNGDHVHDIFVPRFFRHIQSFNIQIFNQWGQLVFETDDPQINWDGSNKRGKSLASGVYFYVCSLSAGPPLNDIKLSGNIHLFR